MILFEVKIMVINMRTETNFLDNNFLCLGFHFFLFFLLLVQEFLVINHPTYGWGSSGGNFHQIHTCIFCNFKCLSQRKNATLYAITDNTNLSSSNTIIDLMCCLFLLKPVVSTTWSRNKRFGPIKYNCYNYLLF